MSWLQLRFDADPASAEALQDALTEVGAAAVTLEDNADQPVYEPGVGETPMWQQTRVTGLFPADADTDALLLATAAHYQQALPPFRCEILEDRDWLREWMSHYQPLQCGERLWICPSWREPVDPAAVNLLLDPGLAFGTGTHPTTWLCLQWLDGEDLQGKTVIDYGCGSGILGIAALLLGADSVIAVDNDPQALLATRDNAQRNGIAESRLSCLLPEQLPADASADYVVANILAGPLISLAPRLSAALGEGGRLCLSGILQSQAETVAERYRDEVPDIAVSCREDWVRLSGSRRRDAAASSAKPGEE